MNREQKIIDDFAATLLDICHAIGAHRDPEVVVAATLASEAIDRWKAGKPWPRLANPNPPPKPNDEPSF